MQQQLSELCIKNWSSAMDNGIADFQLHSFTSPPLFPNRWIAACWTYMEECSSLGATKELCEAMPDLLGFVCRHENASNQQIAVLQQRVKEQEALNAILTHQLASTQAASEHSASDER